MRRQNKQVSESEACRSSSSVFFYPKSNKNQSRVLSKEKTSALSFKFYKACIGFLLQQSGVRSTKWMCNSTTERQCWFEPDS